MLSPFNGIHLTAYCTICHFHKEAEDFVGAFYYLSYVLCTSFVCSICVQYIEEIDEVIVYYLLFLFRSFPFSLRMVVKNSLFEVLSFALLMTRVLMKVMDKVLIDFAR
jgi:hypothetical protein